MILVTGATGHIGNVLVRTLLARGERVRALTLPAEDCSPLAGLPVEIIEGDVLDFTSLRRAMHGVATVFHLAGLISILPGADPLVQSVNVTGTRNVLLAAREAGVGRLIYTSSIHAITRAPAGVVIDEQLPFDPQSAFGAYDRSKAQATLSVLDAAQAGLGAIVVCPTGVIGPYDFRRSEMGQLILDAMTSSLHFSVAGAYDFVDVRDVVQGLLLAQERGLPGEHYILSGEQITISDLIKTVRELAGGWALHVRVPVWLAKLGARIATPLYRLTPLKPRLTPYALEAVASNSHISHAKASRELGYAPRSLRESITDTIAWFKTNLRRGPSPNGAGD